MKSFKKLLAGVSAICMLMTSTMMISADEINTNSQDINLSELTVLSDDALREKYANLDENNQNEVDAFLIESGCYTYEELLQVRENEAQEQANNISLFSLDEGMIAAGNNNTHEFFVMAATGDADANDNDHSTVMVQPCIVDIDFKYPNNSLYTRINNQIYNPQNSPLFDFSPITTSGNNCIQNCAIDLISQLCERESVAYIRIDTSKVLNGIDISKNITYNTVAMFEGTDACNINVVVSPQSATAIEKKIVPAGDLNGNGDIDSADLYHVKRYLLGLIDELTTINTIVADVNCDGKVSSADALAIKKFTLKEMTSFWN